MATTGFTLLEVMIASSLIAVAALSLIGLHGNLQNVRRAASEINRVNALGRSVVERLTAQETTVIGINTASTLKWSRPRFEPASGLPTGASYNPPLTENAANANDDLLATGLITEPTSLTNLKVYIEYYFGASSGAPGGKAGVFDDLGFQTSIVNSSGKLDTASTDKFRQQMANPTFRATYRVDPAQDPASQISDSDTLLIRVVVVWGDGRSIDFYTAKRKEF